MKWKLESLNSASHFKYRTVEECRYFLKQEAWLLDQKARIIAKASVGSLVVCTGSDLADLDVAWNLCCQLNPPTDVRGKIDKAVLVIMLQAAISRLNDSPPIRPIDRNDVLLSPTPSLGYEPMISSSEDEEELVAPEESDDVLGAFWQSLTGLVFQPAVRGGQKLMLRVPFLSPILSSKQKERARDRSIFDNGKMMKSRPSQRSSRRASSISIATAESFPPDLASTPSQILNDNHSRSHSPTFGCSEDQAVHWRLIFCLAIGYLLLLALSPPTIQFALITTPLLWIGYQVAQCGSNAEPPAGCHNPTPCY